MEVATDVYPLTVEEYETVEVVTEDVEVEQFSRMGTLSPHSIFFINKMEQACEAR